MAGSGTEYNDIVKQGYLFVKRPPRKCWEKLKAWHKRYFILRDETPETSPYLEMFEENKECGATIYSSSPKMALNLSQCVHIGYSTDSSKFPYAVVLVCQGKSPLLLAAEDELGTRSWLLALSLITHKEYGKSIPRCLSPVTENNHSQEKVSALDSYSTWQPCTALGQGKRSTCRLGNPFQVTVQPTEASERSELSGDLRLIVCRHGVGLARSGDTECFLLWPVAYLRQFRHQVLSSGWSRATLVTLEVGRRCTTGEGVFQFKTLKGQEIIQELKKMVEMWSTRKTTGRRHSRQEINVTIPEKKSGHSAPCTPSISLPETWQSGTNEQRPKFTPNDDLNYIIPVVEHSPVLSKRKSSCDIIKGRLLHPLSARDGSTTIGRSLPTTPECLSLHDSSEIAASVDDTTSDVNKNFSKSDVEDEGYIEVLPTDLHNKGHDT